MTDDEHDETMGRMVVLVLITFGLSVIITVAFAEMAYYHGYYKGVAVGAKVLPDEGGKK